MRTIKTYFKRAPFYNALSLTTPGVQPKRMLCYLGSPGRNTRGRSGQLAHQQPEDEHMRHQQQRHPKDGDEIGRAQHARRVGERDGVALVEGVQEVESPDDVE